MPVRLVPITLVVIDESGIQLQFVDTATPTIKTTSSRFRVFDRMVKDSYKSKPDDHSKSVPPLPIPNRTVKRLCADDSAATSVKVGYRQASYIEKPRSVI